MRTRSRQLTAGLVMLVVLGGVAPAAAQDPPGRAASESAVRDVVARYVAARAARDAAAIARLFTADADQYTTAGEWRRGRDAIVSGTARSSAQNPGDRDVRVEAVRFVTDDVAIADGPYEIAGATGVRRMWTSLVLVRQAGEWRISAIRNMRPTTSP